MKYRCPFARYIVTFSEGYSKVGVNQGCTTLDFVICGMNGMMIGEGMNQANVRMNESRLNQRIGNNVPVQEQDVQSYSPLTHHQFFSNTISLPFLSV